MQEKQNPPKMRKKNWEREIVCCVWENYVEWEREM